MAYWPTSTSGLNYISYPAGPTVAPVTLTADASANTKGSYSQIAASTSFAFNWIQVFWYSTTTTSGLPFLVDIATGAAASESVKLSNLMAQGASAARNGMGEAILPWSVAASVRISARSQCSTGGTTMIMSITVWNAGSMSSPTSYSTGGDDTSTSSGTTVDTSGSANTKGSYTQLSASVGIIVQFISFITNNNVNSGPQAAAWCIDFATGAAGSEVVLIPDMRQGTNPVSANVNLTNWCPLSHGFATYIASSTRYAMRSSCTLTDATDRKFSVAFLCATAPAESTGESSHGYAG